MQSLFDTNTYEQVLKRIDNLSEDSERQWGKMTVGQMAWHCQFPFKIGVKNKKEGNGNLFVKLFFKKSMYNDKPWRKNLPTAPSLKTKEDKNLEIEKSKLKQLVTDFHQCKTRTDWNPHPIFGKLTHDQWGMMQFKHIDHHLTQFGV
ncbi:DUF1569 domain-containing protein [Aggregatimonas sangjinii]|uniref:DUF1569 domain-containing protein n=1 Tax=Aggregatimonas sangjinii TaxID=2583587 RepID=A0A5B7SWM4_9FLAO|nr:DUF1569 domain-containing protein [Aggregatimonas sangjinii]QCX01094.1 DUF1569 domain-containing protein [Aggregatimonas sangjinii]